MIPKRLGPNLGPRKQGQPMSDPYEWDAFLSHASEDKNDVVIPLANALQARGFRVWFDAFTLKVGDSLNRSINRGLATSRFGVVVLSPSFFAKEWPQRELDGLVAREVEGQKVILPIWHDIDKAGVLRRSPTLADKVAAATKDGIDAVAERIAEAMEPHADVNTSSPVSSQEIVHSTPLGGDLHKARAVQIASGDAPIRLIDHAMLIVHVIPVTALKGQTTEGYQSIAAEPRGFLPMGSNMLQDSQITSDGLLVGSNAEGLSRPQRAYTFVFRSGVVESVASSIKRGRNSNFLILPMLQTLITNQTLRIATTLHRLGFALPYFVHVSIGGVGGVRLLQAWPASAIPEDIPFGVMAHPLTYFDSATLRNLPANRQECFASLRCTLVHLANAANLIEPPPLD
jgi:hypothetical protein